MEKAVFNYSDFFNDDGGFDRIRREFDKLGDDLIKKAKEIREDTKLFDIDQIDQIKEVEERTEDLMKMFKKYESTKIDLDKVEKQVQETQERQLKTTTQQVKSLSKLDKQLLEQRTNLKELNKLGTLNGKVVKDVNEERVKAQIAIKKISAEIRKQQKEVLSANKASKEEEKLAEARLILQKEEIRNRTDLRERIKALRIVVDSLDFETQADEIKAYNNEINELTNKLGETSDKFIQSKINIGNYEESIVNALKNTNLFQGELGVLNNVLGQAIDFFRGSATAQEADAKAKDANARSTTRLARGIRVLNKVAKATVILALIGALASLASAFSQGRKGAILTQQALSRFNVGLRVVINTLGDLGSGLFQIFSGIGSSIGNLFNGIQKFGLEAKLSILDLTNIAGSNSEAIAETEAKIADLNKRIEENKTDDFAKGWDKVTEAVGNFSDRYDDAVTAIQSADEGIVRAFQIADDIRRAELNLIGLRREVALLEIASDDSTTSLRQQLQSTDQLLEKRVELLQAESDIALKNLELANAQARVDAESAGFRLSEDDVEFARQLLDINQQLDPRNNPLNDQFLEETQNALREYLATLDQVQIAEAEIGKQRREISRDLFEQNLDLLIDLIDTEKNLSEQFVTDVTRSFQARIDEFNRFIVVFRQNSQRILDEFTKEAENLGLDLEFDIQFNEDGSFDVLVNDTELAIDNIVELNKQLQNTGLNEIDINRFREFIVETRNGVRDFRGLNRELNLAKVNVNELTENISVSQDELNAIKSLEDRINSLNASVNGDLSESERRRVELEIEQLERDKQAIVNFAEVQRLQNRKNAIDRELDLVQAGSQRELELIQERLDLEKQIIEKSQDDKLERAKEVNQRQLELEEELSQQVRNTLQGVLDFATESQRQRIQESEQRVDRQNELVDIQSQRAQQGLENTLAFEQRELGKREAERIQEEKRQERLAKIRALYSSYNNYASRGDANPIVKALRDFALLEAITASFGEGGIVEDKLPSDGIFRGRSHQGRQGGIPILVEGREGIFSANEMANLGKDNFYKMKELASLGKVDSNFFSKQRSQFVQTVPVGASNMELVSEIKEVKRAIEGKPVQTWDLANITNGTMDLVESIISKNKVKRNHHKVSKKRL